MDCEVIVVGAGVGGLATAALLAARGVNVCVFERQSRGGGCLTNFEHLGYTFEPTAGLYSGWHSGGSCDQLFSAIGSERPEMHFVSSPWIVRFPGQDDIPVYQDSEQFLASLRKSFPECLDRAITFYRTMLQRAQRSNPEKAVQPISLELAGTSSRFRKFIDTQLQTLIQRESDICPDSLGALALTTPFRGMVEIRGGGQGLADSLAAALKRSGGTLRLNAPVLRLAYAEDGSVVGVDLLSGERVTASRAIVSNLTVWDTYGKLFGLNRTPRAIASQLKQLGAYGAYVVYASIEEEAAGHLSGTRFLLRTHRTNSDQYAEDQSPVIFCVAPSWDRRAPSGQRPVTIYTFTNVDEWFSFHEDETAHEGQDQRALEDVWTQLHSAMPELGRSIEVVETATPRTFYESTRRKLGMIGRPTVVASDGSSEWRPGYTTHLSNVFIVGDTTSDGIGVEGVCASAIHLANQIIENSGRK